MNKLQIRQQLRVLSGRYDLVGSSGENLGADFFIDSGQRWLDRKFNHQRSAGRVFKVLSAGDYGVTFDLCRSIKEVWCATADDGRWQLTKLSIQDFRVTYPDLPSELDQGTPLHYTPALLRSVPEADSISSGAFSSYIGFTDVSGGGNATADYNGILIAPPPEEDTLVEVWGYFYTEQMVSDTDQNYWSLNHPDILIMAALRQIEVFNRNTQGVNDWERAIESMLADIDKDMVEQDISEVSQMEG